MTTPPLETAPPDRGAAGGADRGRIVVAALLAAGLVAVGTLAGAGLSPDSVSYVSAARSFASGQGLQVFTGDPLTDWPPLYPLLLSVFGLFGIDAVPASRIVAVLTHAALVGVGGAWLLGRTQTRAVAWAGVTTLVMAPALLWTGVWAWSEGLFMVMSVACLVLLDRHRRTPAAATLVWAAVLAAAAALTRYSGVALIGTGALFLLWTGRARWADAAKRCLGFVALAAMPVALWMLRNRALGEGIVGERSPGQWTVGFNVRRTASLLSAWVVPAGVEGVWAAGAWVLMVGLAGGAVWLAVRSARAQTVAHDVGGDRTPSASSSAPEGGMVRASDGMVRASDGMVQASDGMVQASDGMVQASDGTVPASHGTVSASGADLLFLFVAVYLALILYSGSTVALDVIDERLLAPAFPPFALGLALLVDRAVGGSGGALSADRAALGSGRSDKLFTDRALVDGSRNGPPLTVGRLCGAAFALWFVLAFQATAQVLGAGAAGLGYQSPGWQRSEIVAYLRGVELQGLVQSNDAPGVYLETGLPVGWGPRRHVYASPERRVDDISPLLEIRARGENITMVWFDFAPPYFLSREELQRALPMGSMEVFPGGAVMRVR